MAAEASKLLSSQVALLLTHVESLSLDRPPRRLVDSWRATRQAQGHSTGQIFLTESFPVWFVYFATKRAVEKASHFTGKADCSHVIAELEAKSTEEQKYFAELLNEAIQPDVKDRIQKIKTLCDDSMVHQPNKRRRECFVRI